MWDNVIPIIINGAPTAGKDTFVNCCFIYSDKIRNLSTVDLVKKAAEILGWNGEKDGKSRKFLSDLKDMSTEYNDGPAKYIYNTLQLYDKIGERLIVFIHCREPKEIDKLKKLIGARTLYISADKRIKQDFTNHADANTKNYHYDYYIDNNDTIEELKVKAHDFVEIFDGDVK